jgi:CDP-diacylglycerol--glycerol-3-phosphate 3-phosphatidyltransferase
MSAAQAGNVGFNPMPETTESMRSWVNLPNLLTLIRLALVPVILFLILSERLDWEIMGTILFILAALTDHFDGRIARRRRQVTQFGKFADPLVDKLLTLSVFTAIAMRREFAQIAVYIAIWVAIIAVREIGITESGLSPGAPRW